MKIPKKEVINYIKYVLIIGIFIDICLLLSTFSTKQFPSIKLLVAGFIIIGPSMGYEFYKIPKYYDKMQGDNSFRRYIIYKTTFETILIIVPLWLLMKVLNFI